MSRSDTRAADLRQRGATAVVCDVFDREELLRCVESAQPDAVVHQLTALPKRIDPRKVTTQLAETNRLRTEGTRNLIDAATACGAGRFITQSIAFAYVPDGQGLKIEEDPLYENAPSSFVEVIRAVKILEESTLSASNVEGIVLRYGFLYGPGTSYASDCSFAEDARRRRVPLVGKGSGVFSFVHVDDAAAATVAALERGNPGVYNIVDDEPAPVSEWLPLYAEAAEAPRPMSIPRLLGRLIAGSYAIYLMCEQRGASNEKAKASLDWWPSQPTWRQGFRELIC